MTTKLKNDEKLDDLLYALSQPPSFVMYSREEVIAKVNAHVACLIDDAFDLGYFSGIDSIFDYVANQRKINKFSLGKDSE